MPNKFYLRMLIPTEGIPEKLLECIKNFESALKVYVRPLPEPRMMRWKGESVFATHWIEMANYPFDPLTAWVPVPSKRILD